MLRPVPFLICLFLTLIGLGIGSLASRTRDEALYVITAMDRYISEGRIIPSKTSYGMEDLLRSNYAKLIGGYAYYNLLFDARQLAQELLGITEIRINEPYATNALNIYFLGSHQDSLGILKSSAIRTALSFPAARLIIVNTDFMKELFAIRVIIGPAAADTDFITIPLKKPVEGAEPLTVEDLSENYNMFIGIYIVMHEIGHVLLKHDDIPTAQPSDKELAADEFYVRLITNLIGRPELKQDGMDLGFMFYGDFVNSLHTYASYTTLKETGKLSNQLIYSDSAIELRHYRFLRHPHMLERICRLFTLIKSAPRPKDYTTATSDAYIRMCKRIRIRRTIWPV
jgi:hypothetical protein